VNREILISSLSGLTSEKNFLPFYLFFSLMTCLSHGIGFTRVETIMMDKDKREVFNRSRKDDEQNVGVVVVC
jgi:hypothetical protein